MSSERAIPLQRRLPYDPFVERRLPGIQPLEMADWLIRDEAFAPQMALRDHLLRTRRVDVLADTPVARSAAGELLELVLKSAYAGQQGDQVVRPDGVRVTIDRNCPLETLGRLVQEDLCVLQKSGSEHVLSAAVLCFPAGWTLDEKLGQPLGRIHRPVAAYDDVIAARVQRLFDGVKVDRPLWRFNALWYEKPDLFAPMGEDSPRARGNLQSEPYFRSERQCILRLPKTRAVVFSIHTYVLKRGDVVGMQT